MTPSHYLNQCWSMISGVLWNTHDIYIKMSLKIMHLRLQPHLLGLSKWMYIPGGGGGGGTRSENCWGCAVGHWKLDPKRSRGKWYFGAKKIEFCEDLYPKDRFCVGGWEKTPQKDQVWYPVAQKRGSKPQHICITHHIGSTPPPPPPPRGIYQW